MTAKSPAAKKQTQPRKSRKPAAAKTAPEQAKAEGFEDVTLMKAFHQGDAIARTLYPAQAWDAQKEASAMRVALITAMNLYSSGYVYTQGLLRDMASEKLTQVAVKHTLGQMPEDVLTKLNGETLAIADALGMPLTPRAPFTRSINDVTGLAQQVRHGYAHLDRPLTMHDLQTYYYTTYFSMSPVAYFVTTTEDYGAMFKTLLSNCGASAFLQFIQRDINLLPVADNSVQANPMWHLGVLALDSLDKLIAAFADPECANPTAEAFIEKSRGVSEADVGLGQLIDYVMGHVQSSAV